MATILISNQQMQFPFGAQTNQAIGRLIGLNTTLARLREAIANASAGYEGTAGTQFETPPETGEQPSLFGVIASATPGEKGEAYRYAMESLDAAWQSFWTVAAPFIEALDNGQVTM
jgi:hypothetical protein